MAQWDGDVADHNASPPPVLSCQIRSFYRVKPIERNYGDPENFDPSHPAFGTDTD